MNRIIISKSPSHLTLTKRQRIALLTLLLTLVLAGLLWTSFGGLFSQIIWLGLIYGVVIIILDQDLKREEWLILPLYPLIWGVVCLGWLTVNQPSFPLLSLGALVFGLGLYAILLAINIVNIATVRTVPLLRTATTALHVLGLWCSFGLLYLLRAEQPSLWTWVGGSVAINIVTSLPLLWISCANPGKLKRAFAWSSLVGLLTGQIAALNAFWPSSFMSSLVLASTSFIFIGLLHYQEQRTLTTKTERQYLLLSLTIFLAFYLLTYWGS